MARRYEIGTWALALLLLLGNSAQAQGDPEAGDDTEAPAPASGSSFSAGAGAHTSSSSSGSSSNLSYKEDERPHAASSASGSGSPASDDHMAAVGTIGIGFFGVNTIPIMDCGNGMTMTCVPGTTNDLSAPTIGARYWLHENFGIELGAGLRIASASNGPLDVSQFGLAVHGGFPLALAHASHFVFEIVPQLNVGFATGSFKITSTGSTDKTSLSGFLLEAGAKAGAEVHFGFMGLPQLSLQGTLGVMFRHESRTAEIPNGNNTNKSEQSATTFATGVDGNPWDIFQGAITAIYYFY